MCSCISFRRCLLAVSVVALALGCGGDRDLYQGLPPVDGPPRPRDASVDGGDGSASTSRWSLGDENAEGVRVDEESDGLTLDWRSSSSQFIWVANTEEGSVSKVDVNTLREVGRYYTGRDPSRTSVNINGDVYVGNRFGFSVTKVLVGGEDGCPDTNGDGLVTTSSGSDLLDFGEDDCVAWTTPVEGRGPIRAVAAQDVSGPDGGLRSYVWVGGYYNHILKLDGETGRVLFDTAAPVRPYGFALDGRGNLWISDGQSSLGRLDTTVCVDADSCDTEICGDDGDDCVKQTIHAPGQIYGITVDREQRVWVGGSVARYDPDQPFGHRWTEAGVGVFVHGIAADSRGWIWGAAMSTVVQIDGEAPLNATRISAASGYSAKGAAVDALGQVWMINLAHNNATLIVPTDILGEAEVFTEVTPFFRSPYTYSDMTGTQLRQATLASGHFREVFTVCPGGETSWTDLSWDAFVPEGTSLTFRGRTAEDAESLSEAEWFVIARVPADTSPISIADALEAALANHGALLEVEVHLHRSGESSNPSLSPVVFDFQAEGECAVY